MFACQKDKGYVGYGVVTIERLPLHEISAGPNGSRIDSLLPSIAKQLNQSNPDSAAHGVGVRWERTIDLDDARWEKGLSASQWTACRLTHAPTIAFLEREFELTTAAPAQER